METVVYGGVRMIGNPQHGHRKEPMSQKEPKTFHLTELEQSNLESRYSLIKQYQYLIHVLNNDIVGYVKLAVYPRLSIDQDKDYVLSPDNKELTIKENNATTSKN